MNFVELFAGAGGLSEGFIANGFKPIAFIERDKYCCDTLRTRQAYFELKKNRKLSLYKKYLLEQISRDELYKNTSVRKLNLVINQEINNDTTNILIKDIKEKLKNKKLDIILGGPPCQAYSLIGKKNPNDERLYLYKYYLQFLKGLKPNIFIFENVPGLLSIKKGELFKSIIKDFQSLGYSISYKILNASDYNVLQNRNRLIVIGCLKKKINVNDFLINQSKGKYKVEDVFRDLHPLSPGEIKNKYIETPSNYLLKNKIRNHNDVLTLHQARPHNERDLNIYKFIIEAWNKNKVRLKYPKLPDDLKSHKNEKSFLDRFKVVGGNLPASHTVVAHIAKDGHHYIHPDIKQCRSISVRESARIQSFKDDYFFEGPRTSKFSQIGNAVPPLLSQYLAKEIKKHYES